MLISKHKIFGKRVELHVIDIAELNMDISCYIDKNLVHICEGSSGTDLLLVKSNFIKFLATKDENTRLGAVAEFFVHLYMKQQGFKQEFLFFNLEEGSIKKGFDGYFSKGGLTFIVESKSGSALTRNISHRSKLKEAYDDLKSVLAGASRKSKNNPWKNAYNHASHVDVGANKSIRKKIKELSDSFDNNLFSVIKDFNIVPCSTIFFKGSWDVSPSGAILSESAAFYESMEAKSVIALCITKSSYQAFVDYLQDSK